MLGRPRPTAGMLGGADRRTRVALLTGSMGGGRAPRRRCSTRPRGEAGIVIGTHALLEEKVQFFDLGLVVVDEQHRFGVEQRAALTGKAGTAAARAGDDRDPDPAHGRDDGLRRPGHLHPHRAPRGPRRRPDHGRAGAEQPGWLDRAWQRIREEVAAGRQAYVVCSADRRRATRPRTRRRSCTRRGGASPRPCVAGPLTGLRVEMLHGRMAPEDKDRVMRAFAAGEVDVLVSTTVIEVGVDVPNATVMVILDADRFGVSQLHQLRGRIGRGGHAGTVPAGHPAHPGRPRHRSGSTRSPATRDGFELSRIDLSSAARATSSAPSRAAGAPSLELLSVLHDEDVIARGPRGRDSPILAPGPRPRRRRRRLRSRECAALGGAPTAAPTFLEIGG